jgi:hypothetical protein
VKRGIIFITLFLSLLLCATGCGFGTSRSESREAKELLQGIWVNEETEDVVFKVSGDTIYYPDTLSLPAYFRVVNDTLEIGDSHYHIQKQASHVFWFHNRSNELVKLRKSDDPEDVQDFKEEVLHPMAPVTELQKTDSIVFYNGQRYHWYIAINPTRYRVTKASYSQEGVEVENIYFDNIIHISIYQGNQRLFSSDIKKQMYDQLLSEDFLALSVLGNMVFGNVDADGFHFLAQLGIPDGESYYSIVTTIGFDGALTTKLQE